MVKFLVYLNRHVFIMKKKQDYAAISIAVVCIRFTGAVVVKEEYLVTTLGYCFFHFVLNQKVSCCSCDQRLKVNKRFQIFSNYMHRKSS